MAGAGNAPCKQFMVSLSPRVEGSSKQLSSVQGSMRHCKNPTRSCPTPFETPHGQGSSGINQLHSQAPAASKPAPCCWNCQGPTKDRSFSGGSRSLARPQTVHRCPQRQRPGVPAFHGVVRHPQRRRTLPAALACTGSRARVLHCGLRPPLEGSACTAKAHHTARLCCALREGRDTAHPSLGAPHLDVVDVDAAAARRLAHLQLNADTAGTGDIEGLGHLERWRHVVYMGWG